MRKLVNKILFKITMKTEVRAPKNEDEWEQYYNLRYEVLSKPSGSPKSSVYHEEDSTAFHAACFADGEIIGVGRLHYNDDDFDTGYVRFMAVSNDHRSQGIGSKVLNKLEEIAAEHGTKKMFLKARESALDFYLKNNYKKLDKCNEKFFRTPHWNMEKYI